MRPSGNTASQANEIRERAMPVNSCDRNGTCSMANLRLARSAALRWNSRVNQFLTNSDRAAIEMHAIQQWLVKLARRA